MNFSNRLRHQPRSSALRPITILWAITLLVLAACANRPTPAPGNANATRSLQVIATFSIIGDFVHQVGGDKVEITTLVGPNSDVHDFEPAPSDVTKLASAHVIFENGLGLETWLDPLYQASKSSATRVVLSAGITPRSADEDNHADGNDAHDHGEFDPHIWQNVQYARQMVGHIASGLSQADPANAALYQRNAQAYMATLDALDAEVLGKMNGLPSANRKLVTSHDALGYYAERYGLTLVGDILGSVSTEASEPSAQQLAALVETIKAQHVKVIFLETITNPQLVERVAQEAGVVIGPELYTDALGDATSAGATYVDAIRHNTDAITNALK